MKIQESGENYLETILLLEMRNGTVRAVDIANELGYSKPSVTRAMGVLKKAGLVDQELYPVFLVIHKSQHAHGARRDIQKLFHISIFSERESCRADL